MTQIRFRVRRDDILSQIKNIIPCTYEKFSTLQKTIQSVAVPLAKIPESGDILLPRTYVCFKNAVLKAASGQADDACWELYDAIEANKDEFLTPVELNTLSMITEIMAGLLQR